jgi:hypothetical protein
MLDPEVVVNLLPKLGVGVDFVRHSHWFAERFNHGARRLISFTSSVSPLSSETNEFHKHPSFHSEVNCSKSARNEEPSSRGAFNGGLASGDSGSS